MVLLILFNIVIVDVCSYNYFLGYERRLKRSIPMYGVLYLELKEKLLFLYYRSLGNQTKSMYNIGKII